MTPVPGWRRNLFAVTAVSFIGYTGFTLVMPFLPIFFSELGLTDVGAISMWAGLCLGVTPGMTAIFAPLWGRLADRFGRKVMVARSMIAFSIVMAASALVTAPWQMLALRILVGLFAGYGALTLTMAADSAPPGRLAQSIGSVQVAQRLGPALGPVIGGALAAIVGLRRAFLFSALFYATGLLLILFVYQDVPRDARQAAVGGAAAGTSGVRGVLRLSAVPLLMFAIFGVQFVDRSFGPILPLYLAARGLPEARVSVLAGVLYSVAAGGGALGNVLCAVLLRRVAARAVVAASAGLGALACAVFIAHVHTGVLVAAMLLFGVAGGAGMTGIYTAAGAIFSEADRATGFAVLTSASLAGLAISPVIAGFVAGGSLRSVFVLDAVALVVVIAAVLRYMRGIDTRSRPVPAADAARSAHHAGGTGPV